jgi:hypothetical protein
LVPEQLLNVLKICMLVLLYLFFLRVLRAVWAEVREPATSGGATTRGQRGARRRRSSAPPVVAAAPVTAGGATAAGPAPGPAAAHVGPTRLVPIEGTGMPPDGFMLNGETTIGRAPTCTIEVDDSYASAVHSRIVPRDGGWILEDLGSTNGTYLNRRKVSAPTQLSVGDRIAIGTCSWEVR